MRLQLLMKLNRICPKFYRKCVNARIKKMTQDIEYIREKIEFLERSNTKCSENVEAIIKANEELRKIVLDDPHINNINIEKDE